MSEKQQPIFSLCHTTIRLPDGWRSALQAWHDRADHPELVEHVFVTDEPVPAFREMVMEGKAVFHNTVLGVNYGPKSCVAGWNLAAKLSTGKFLINVADDLYPPEHWDTELLKVIPDLDKECVLEVNTGGNHGLLTFCMVTRAYYERYGYLLYPEYISVFSDNDFTDTARRNGVVVNARHLLFEHKHPLYDKSVKTDDAYLWQSRPEAWEKGKKLYTERSLRAGMKVRKKLAVCLPGEHYSSMWVVNWTQLMSQLMPVVDLVPIFGYSSNVYITRACMSDTVKCCKPAPDYVLWMDDDNILTWEHLVMLMDDLEKRPEVDSVSGWSWIQPDVIQTEAKISCGQFSDDRTHCIPLTYEELMEGKEDLKEIEYTGFPAVLMRYETITRAGQAPFAPIPNPKHPYGFSGEDTSFCMNAKDRGGCRFFVDRRVKVPHLKLRAAEPMGITLTNPVKYGEEVPLEMAVGQ